MPGMQQRGFRSWRASMAVVLALCWPLLTVAAEVQPLDAAELALAQQQIEAMRKTSERDTAQFVMDARTPALIDRLLQTPAQWLALTPTERSNALVLAAQSGSSLLQVQRPSEVVARIDQWFPEGMASARKEERLWAGHVQLFGPFANWPLPPGVFLALWNCTPQSAWLHPQDNPFTRAHAGNGLPLYPLAARQSSTEEFDFGFCVRERNGYLSAWSEAERAELPAYMQKLSAPLIPPLIELFAHTLDTLGCTANGADDCVLLLRQWASLRPEDPALAQQLQRLAPLVDAGGPLPDWQGVFDSGQPQLETGKARFDAGLRRAAFLQARLRSVLAAPQAWPQDALAQTLEQMSALRAQQESPFTRQFSYYQIDYYNEPINPWGILFNEYRPSEAPRWNGEWTEQPRPAGQLAQLRPAVLVELRRLNRQECHLSDPLLKVGGGPELTADFVLASLRGNPPALPNCATLDYDWLQTDAAAPVREQLLSLLPQLGGKERESLLGGLTVNAERCFPPPAAPAPEGSTTSETITPPAPVPEWQQALCRQWISQPQAVDPAAFPQAAGQYQAQPLQPEGEVLAADWPARLPGSTPALQAALQREREQLQHCGQDIYAVTLWQSASGGPQLLELSISGGSGTDASCPALSSRALLLREGDQLQLIQVPARFSYQYDDGGLERVSDIDADGHLELWFTGTFGECDGEEEPVDDSAASEDAAESTPAEVAPAGDAAAPAAPAGETADSGTPPAAADAPVSTQDVAAEEPADAGAEEAATATADDSPVDSEDTSASEEPAAVESDCVSTVSHMGEIDGDVLGWFHDDRRPQ